MIGYLSGQYLYQDNGACIVLTHGVGYEVFIPTRQANNFHKHQELSLHTHMIVREDAQQLYGFTERHDRDVFRILLKANQVGPKLALMILDTYTCSELYQTIRDERLDLIRRIKGIGPKMGERLLVQLKGFLQDFPAVAPTAQTTNHTDALDALLRLGYKESVLQQILRDIPAQDTASTIKQALAKLSHKENA